MGCICMDGVFTLSLRSWGWDGEIKNGEILYGRLEGSCMHSESERARVIDGCMVIFMVLQQGERWSEGRGRGIVSFGLVYDRSSIN
jgi:hypothetical protein